MEKRVKCDLTGQESEWFKGEAQLPDKWIQLRMSMTGTVEGVETHYARQCTFNICPDAAKKIRDHFPEKMSISANDFLLQTLQEWVAEEVSEALSNQ